MAMEVDSDASGNCSFHHRAHFVIHPVGRRHSRTLSVPARTGSRTGYDIGKLVGRSYLVPLLAGTEEQVFWSVSWFLFLF